MKLFNYVPEFLKEVLEIKAICETEDAELDTLKVNISGIYKETIVNEATEYGIGRYEKIFGLKPKATDTLETRKKRVLYKITNRLPYSMKWLKNKLDLMAGVNNYTIALDYSTYDLIINVSGITTEQLITLQNELKFMLPVNLVVDVKIEESSQMSIYFGGYTHISTEYLFTQAES